MSPVLLVGYQISGLIDGETAVGDDDRTGDVTRFIGSEVQDRRRLFFRSRVAALQGLGLAGDHGILHEFGRINALRLQFGDLGIDLFLGRFSQRRIGAGRADRVADEMCIRDRSSTCARSSSGTGFIKTGTPSTVSTCSFAWI